MIIIPVTIALIFVLLYATFRSALDAGLVLLSVPFSMAGGLMALYFRGIHKSVSAAVGFISLFGVAVMSGLLYISEIRRRRRDSSVSLREAVILGAQSQFRPMLILILVAMLGMIPSAVARDMGPDIQRPLATVIIGGLMSTLGLTSLALPAVH
jgi:heavy metal efflux system protein